MNWDDLRVIAAVRDEGTYAGASARLRIDETTVGRRLARIQRSLGIPLFEAVDGIRKPTPQCELVVARIRAMTEQAAEISRIGQDTPGVTGRFRIASTVAIAEEVLSPRAGVFLLRNPGLTLHFLSSAENVSFSRWQADIAIRLRKPAKGNFTISKLADARLYFFEPAVQLEGEPVVCGYPLELEDIPEAKFLKAKSLEQRCTTDNVRVIRALIQSYRAIGILPEYSCADMLGDRRLRITLLPHRREVWLLTQDQLKRNPATRVVTEWIRSCFKPLA
jgi:DNA-binding transcriptional LysR family regulator